MALRPLPVLLGLGAVAGIIFFATRGSAATGASSFHVYDVNSQVPVLIGGPTVRVPVGASVQVTNPSGSGDLDYWWATTPATNDATVLAPADHMFQSHNQDKFVALRSGTVTVSGTYLDKTGKTIPASVTITVV